MRFAAISAKTVLVACIALIACLVLLVFFSSQIFTVQQKPPTQSAKAKAPAAVSASPERREREVVSKPESQARTEEPKPASDLRLRFSREQADLIEDLSRRFVAKNSSGSVTELLASLADQDIEVRLEVLRELALKGYQPQQNLLDALVVAAMGVDRDGSARKKLKVLTGEVNELNGSKSVFSARRFASAIEPHFVPFPLHASSSLTPEIREKLVARFPGSAMQDLSRHLRTKVKEAEANIGGNKSEFETEVDKIERILAGSDMRDRGFHILELLRDSSSAIAQDKRDQLLTELGGEIYQPDQGVSQMVGLPLFGEVVAGLDAHSARILIAPMEKGLESPQHFYSLVEVIGALTGRLEQEDALNMLKVIEELLAKSPKGYTSFPLCVGSPSVQVYFRKRRDMGLWTKCWDE
ncbi:MAG: hypothetical protein AAF394_07225 [Planctomycetota bacterium]